MLTVKGHQQVTLLSQSFTDIPIGQLLTSPSVRAQQTAKAISVATGVEVTTLDGLQEREFIPLQGLSTKQILDRFGREALNSILSDVDTLDLDGCETVGAAKARIIRTLHGALDTNSVSPVVVVSHGGPHGWLIANLLGISNNHVRRLTLGFGHFSLFDWDTERGEICGIESLNCPPSALRNFPLR